MINKLNNYMENYQDLLNWHLGNNILKEYLWAIAIFIAVYLVLKIFKIAIVRRLKKLAKKTKTDIDDAVVAILDYLNWPFYFIFSLYLAVQSLNLSELAGKIFYYIFLITVVYYAVRIASLTVDFITKKAVLRDQEDARKDHQVIIGAVNKVVKFCLWAIAIVLLLSNLGYNVTSLVAGLGIGGIAIALAVQNVLGDVFSSLSIFFDKPFTSGDFIVVGDQMGTVKKIGLKTTRIQTLQGEELVISNNDLTSARIQNFKEMEKRRIVFTIGATYETKPEKLSKIPKMIEDIIRKVKGAEFDRAHFKSFGDFSLNYEIVYYVDSSEYEEYMDIQEKINFAIVEAFSKEKIEFAYPTQTVFVKK